MSHTVHRTWEYDPALYAPARYRKACRYEAFVPDPLERLDLDLPGEVAGVVSDAEAAIHALNARGSHALAPLARLLMRTESIASSKVEGVAVDARALARAEVKAETGGSPSATALEVLANIDAMQLAVEHAAGAETVGLEAILDIHRALMAGSPTPEIGGEVRAEQNWIGGNDYNPCGADFVPPPPEEVGRLLDDLCRFSSTEMLPPLVQAAIAHAQFETIHPFTDGNGRTGRALVQVVLRRRGLAPRYVPPVSVVLAADKARYISGLTAFRGGAVAIWVHDFAVASARAAHQAEQYLTRAEDLTEEWTRKLRAGPNPRSDAAAWAVIDVLAGYPVITVGVAVAATGRTKPAVGAAINQLVEAGVLVPLSASKRNRAWEAAGLLDLVVEMDRS